MDVTVGLVERVPHGDRFPGRVAHVQPVLSALTSHLGFRHNA